MKKIETALTDLSTKFQHGKVVAEIISAALEAVNPENAVARNLACNGDLLVAGSTEILLTAKSKIITIALGKAAPAMMRSAIKCLGERYHGGVCVSKHFKPDDFGDSSAIYITGNHPVPGEGSLQAGIEIRKVLSGLTEDDVVLLLVSGGGSSLVTSPVEGVTLRDIQTVTSTLLRSGATIAELNSVRKHLDMIKGGGLVRLAAPAKVAALVLSDVVGDPLEVIASGPAYPDPSTFADALAVLGKAAKHESVPGSIHRHMVKGVEGKIPETLKADEPDAGLGFNKIIANNKDACAAAVAMARKLGFSAEIVSESLVGEARTAGVQIAATARSRAALRKPFMRIWGGETTVTVTGKGKGGRNLELALASVKGMAGLAATHLLTLATDGEDGPTDAAGAVVSGDTLEKATKLGLSPDDYLWNNDSYEFFSQLGDLLITGPTGTNVNDLTFLFEY